MRNRCKHSHVSAQLRRLQPQGAHAVQNVDGGSLVASRETQQFLVAKAYSEKKPLARVCEGLRLRSQPLDLFSPEREALLIENLADYSQQCARALESFLHH
jgi:hypothetical protein